MFHMWPKQTHFLERKPLVKTCFYYRCQEIRFIYVSNSTRFLANYYYFCYYYCCYYGVLTSTLGRDGAGGGGGGGRLGGGERQTQVRTEGWVVVVGGCIVLFTLCIIILWARHDHNKIAPCGMIKVFLIELNKNISALNAFSNILFILHLFFAAAPLF